MINLHAIGGEQYYIYRQNPGSTLTVLAIGYYLCYRYSAKDAVNDAIDNNLRQKDLEEFNQ